MARFTIVTSVALMLLGIAFYLLSGESSITALIPSLFGLPLFAFGMMARDEHQRKHAMHGAVLFGTLGFLASFVTGYPKWRMMMAGTEVPLQFAAWEELAMAMICGLFVILCVNSFIAARKMAE